jgi:hypothetical protein
MATIISPIKKRTTILVKSPSKIKRPPIISAVPMKFANTSGNGNPNFVKRPTPWLGYTNFKIPSQKKTPPAISRRYNIEDGPKTGGEIKNAINFFMTKDLIQKK